MAWPFTGETRALVTAGGEAVGLGGGCRCHRHPEQNVETRQKNADGKMRRGASKSALPSGQERLYLQLPDVCLAA